MKKNRASSGWLLSYLSGWPDWQFIIGLILLTNLRVKIPIPVVCNQNYLQNQQAETRWGIMVMSCDESSREYIIMLSVPSPYATSFSWLSSHDGWPPIRLHIRLWWENASYVETPRQGEISWILRRRREPSHCYRVCSNNYVVLRVVRQLCIWRDSYTFSGTTVNPTHASY